MQQKSFIRQLGFLLYQIDVWEPYISIQYVNHGGSFSQHNIHGNSWLLHILSGGIAARKLIVTKL